MRPIVTLLTDFGTADGYVAEMKGVLVSSVPDIDVVDLSHEIAPQDIDAARLAVARYWRRFPGGTVHLVVIDPGVGTDRAGLAVQSEERFLVGPDNGVLSPALLMGGARVVALPVPPNASPTFHGRDIFAPAAALLATGVGLDALGRPLAEPVIRRTPEAQRLPDGGVAGQVILIDRYGNAVTNLVSGRGGVLEVAGRTLEVRRAYADVAPGGLLALTGSSGLIEVAQRDGNAAATLRLTRGTVVVLRARAV